MTLSPLVLFVYNRPWHTQQTIESLQKNELAKESELFIYSDAPKNETDVLKVNEVRKYIRSISGFKKIIIIKRNKNWGLANSIIDGVTKIVNDYGKIIVLEDDLVISPYFLKFMNEALEFYKDEKKVWHISGWNYPIESDGLEDTFLWRAMNCWGWATWSDRWSYYEKDTQKIATQFSKEEIKAFNIDGYYRDFWAQVKDNRDKRIDTWAIFWYATIFKNSGLCLNPVNTFVRNIGNDGSGENCISYDIYQKELNHRDDIRFIISKSENKLALAKIKLFYKQNPYKLMDRIKSKLKRVFK